MFEGRESLRKQLCYLCLFWYFFAEGLLAGNWAGTILQVQEDLDINNGILGDALFAAAIGAVLAVPIVPMIDKKIGSRNCCFIGALLLCGSFILIGLSTVFNSVFVLATGTFCMGFSIILMDAAINNQASWFSIRDKYPVFGKCHGIYSLGCLTGGLAGGYMIQSFTSITEFAAVTIFVAITLPITYFGLISMEEEAQIVKLSMGRTPSMGSLSLTQYNPNKQDYLPHEIKLISLICLIVFISYFGEGSIADWSAIYNDQTWSQESDVVSVLGFVGFHLSEALARFNTDNLIDKLDRKVVLSFASILCAIGLVTVCTASLWKHSSYDGSFAVCIIGFTITGLGCGPIAPVTISIASSGFDYRTKISVSQAIAWSTAIGFLGMEVGPPVMGNVSDLAGGLQWSFLLEAGLFASIVIWVSMIHLPSPSTTTSEKITLPEDDGETVLTENSATTSVTKIPQRLTDAINDNNSLASLSDAIQSPMYQSSSANG
jgi:MFS family permease